MEDKKKIFVGNLPWSIDDAKLNEVFSKFGEVSEAKVITDKFSGRSRGFGFVSFSTEEEAQKAVKEMNGSEIESRKLTVNIAKPAKS